MKVFTKGYDSCSNFFQTLKGRLGKYLEERSTTGQTGSGWRSPLSWKWLEVGRGLAEKINYVHPILAVLLGSLLWSGFWSLLQTGYCSTWAPKVWNNNTVLIFLFELWANCVQLFWCVDEFKVLCLPICAWAGGESTAGSSGATAPVGSRSFPQLHHGYSYQMHGET